MVRGKKIHQMAFSHLTHITARYQVLIIYSKAPGADGKIQADTVSSRSKGVHGNGVGGQLLHRGGNH